MSASTVEQEFISPLQAQPASHSAAQSHLWNLIYAFADSMLLRSAVELGIPDIIESNSGSITLTQLASHLSVDPEKLFRILRSLARMGLIDQHEADAETGPVYSLAPTAQFLLTGSENSMVPIIKGIVHRDFLLPWHFLKEGLSNGPTTAFEKAMGMSMWEYLEKDKEKSKVFDEVMAADTKLTSESLIRGYEGLFDGVESVVDVGGGNGSHMKAVSEAFPHLKHCIVFDLPHVIANTADIPGVDRIAGDMFEGVPTAQAIMLKLVLHDWGDEDCIKVLKKCKEALPKEGGKVVIVDAVLDENSDFAKSILVIDIDMLINTGGGERTVDDWKALILSAGFKNFKVKQIGRYFSAIEAFPS